MELWLTIISELSSGLAVTLELVVISAPLGVLLGIALGTSAVYGGRISALISRSFSLLLRGFPLLVTMMLIFFGLPELGIDFSPEISAVLAILLCSGAYVSEYVRSAIMSIDEGQSLAAKSLGMTETQEIVHVILPQALRRAMPSISNEVIYMIQYSSLAYAIGVREIYSVAKSLNSIIFRPLEVFSVLAVFYLALCYIASHFFNWVERRLERNQDVPPASVSSKPLGR